jgi:hypothetical protein
MCKSEVNLGPHKLIVDQVVEPAVVAAVAY